MAQAPVSAAIDDAAPHLDASCSSDDAMYATPDMTAGMKPLVLRVQYAPRDDELLFVGGSLACLGGWDVNNAAPMTYVGGEIWEFRGSIPEDELRRDISYKFAMAGTQEASRKIWENAEARRYSHQDMNLTPTVEKPAFAELDKISALRRVSERRSRYGGTSAFIPTPSPLRGSKLVNPASSIQKLPSFPTNIGRQDNNINIPTPRLQLNVQPLRNQTQALKKDVISLKDDVAAMSCVLKDVAGEAIQSLLQVATSAVTRAEDAHARAALLHRALMGSGGFVHVVLRVRPPFDAETSSVQLLGDQAVSVGRTTAAASKVVGPDMPTDACWSEMEPLVQSVLDGDDACVLAYGATGSGKTHTMLGEAALRAEGGAQASYEDAGLITLTANYLLQQAPSGTTLDISILEVYGESIRDLLSMADESRKKSNSKGAAGEDQSESLSLQRDPVTKKVVVIGACSKPVTNAGEALSYVSAAAAVRAIGATSVNAHSSRSHLIVSLMLKRGGTNCARLFLVDLAGSERAGRTGAEGLRLKEAMAINKSLSALFDVVAARSAGHQHVPYRNAKLTHILADALDGSARLLMIACLDPRTAGETAMTLQFASRMIGMKAQESVASKGQLSDITKKYKASQAKVVALERRLQEMESQIDETARVRRKDERRRARQSTLAERVKENTAPSTIAPVVAPGSMTARPNLRLPPLPETSRYDEKEEDLRRALTSRSLVAEADPQTARIEAMLRQFGNRDRPITVKLKASDDGSQPPMDHEAADNDDPASPISSPTSSGSPSSGGADSLNSSTGTLGLVSPPHSSTHSKEQEKKEEEAAPTVTVKSKGGIVIPKLALGSLSGGASLSLSAPVAEKAPASQTMSASTRLAAPTRSASASGKIEAPVTERRRSLLKRPSTATAQTPRNAVAGGRANLGPPEKKQRRPETARGSGSSAGSMHGGAPALSVRRGNVSTPRGQSTEAKGATSKSGTPSFMRQTKASANQRRQVN